MYASCYRYARHFYSFTKLRPNEIAVSDINKFAFIVEGVETIAHTISRYAIFEQIYLGRVKTATHAMRGLKEALVRLYAVILKYLSKAKSYLEENTASVSFHDFRSHIVAK